MYFRGTTPVEPALHWPDLFQEPLLHAPVLTMTVKGTQLGDFSTSKQPRGSSPSQTDLN